MQGRSFPSSRCGEAALDRNAIDPALPAVCEVPQQPQRCLANLRLGLYFQGARPGIPGLVAAPFVLLRGWQVSEIAIRQADDERRPERTLRLDRESGFREYLGRRCGDSEVADPEGLNLHGN